MEFFERTPYQKASSSSRGIPVFVLIAVLILFFAVLPLAYALNESPITTSATIADTDGDGLSDNRESYYGTSPLNSDTDSDGYTDYEEVEVYFSPPRDNCKPDPKNCSTPQLYIIIQPPALIGVQTAPQDKEGKIIPPPSLFAIEKEKEAVEVSWIPPISGAFEGFVLLKDTEGFVSEIREDKVVYRGKDYGFKDENLISNSVHYYTLFVYGKDKTFSKPVFGAILVRASKEAQSGRAGGYPLIPKQWLDGVIPLIPQNSLTEVKLKLGLADFKEYAFVKAGISGAYQRFFKIVLKIFAIAIALGIALLVALMLIARRRRKRNLEKR